MNLLIFTLGYDVVLTVVAVDVGGVDIDAAQQVHVKGQRAAARLLARALLS